MSISIRPWLAPLQGRLFRGGRSGPPPFAARGGVFRRLGAFFPTLWASLAARRFGATLAVHSGRRQAREFAVLACGVTGVIALGLVPMYWPEFKAHRFWLGADPERLYELQVLATVGGTWLGGVLLTAGVLLAVGSLLTVFGWVDPARRGLVLCYASGWLVPTALLSMGGVWGAYWVLEHWRCNIRWQWPLIGWISTDAVIAGLMMMPAVGAGLLWLLHLRHMLRATRYANA